MPTCITFFLHATCNDNTTSGTHMSRQIKPLLAVPDQPVRRVHHTAGVGWMQPHGEECMLVQLRGGEVCRRCCQRPVPWPGDVYHEQRSAVHRHLAGGETARPGDVDLPEWGYLCRGLAGR